MNKLKVGIIFGGDSLERDISLITAMQVISSIDTKKYECVGLYLLENGKIIPTSKFHSKEELRSLGISFSSKSKKRFKANFRADIKLLKSFDVIIMALHGKNTESGEIYGYLKTFNIPCTSSGVLASSIMQSKTITKLISKALDINYIDYIYIDKEDFYGNEEVYLSKIKELGNEYIIKADKLGSSIGIFECDHNSDIISLINQAFMYDERIVIEKKINNFKEYNCAYIKTSDKRIVSNVEEVKKDEKKIYDFDMKYKSNNNNKVFLEEDDELSKNIKEISSKIIDVIEGYGVIRCDFIYDLEENKLYLNEINNIPGALSYYLFESKGIYFDELLDILIDGAIKRAYNESKLINEYESDVLNYSFNNKINGK